jgi:exosome complex RNA-binding protein Rrp42 (RNase PH superfamily)
MQTSIVPVPVFPSTANVLTIRSITLGPPPQYFYELSNVLVVPPVAEQLDPTTGAVIVAAQDEQTIVTVLKSGNVSMTSEQWAAWPADADDDEVQLNAISLNLGLTRV